MKFINFLPYFREIDVLLLNLRYSALPYFEIRMRLYTMISTCWTPLNHRIDIGYLELLCTNMYSIINIGYWLFILCWSYYKHYMATKPKNCNAEAISA